jgi:two-component system response regulator VicR
MPKILIVEDYLDLKDFFTLLLKKSDFDVRSASSKQELFTQLEAFTPDLVLLDIMLGGDCGREICKELKKNHKGIAVILISANPKLLLDHEECFADDTIEKPFNNTAVLDKIRAVLEKKTDTAKSIGQDQ